MFCKPLEDLLCVLKSDIGSELIYLIDGKLISIGKTLFKLCYSIIQNALEMFCLVVVLGCQFVLF